MTLRDAIAPAVGFSTWAHVEATWLEYPHLTSMRSRRCPRQQQRGGGVDMLPFLLLDLLQWADFVTLRHLVGRGWVLYRHQAMSVVEAVDQYLSEQPPFWLVQVKLLTCRHGFGHDLGRLPYGAAFGRHTAQLLAGLRL